MLFRSTSRTLPFLSDFRSQTGLHATLLHLLIYASVQMLKDRPRMNRFVAGGRIFQRRGIWISFSAKKRKTEDAPIVLVKREIDPSWSFEELVQQIEGGISEGRSDKHSTTDTELSLIFKLPINKFKIVIHPQSLIHAIVQFNNGLSSMLYHYNDMKIPIIKIGRAHV